MKYRNDKEIEAAVRRLENCEYRKDEFTHVLHLSVAAWYLEHHGYDEALTRMRSSLLRFTAHHGVTGYHETITQFWLRLCQQFLANRDHGISFGRRVNALVEAYGDKQILFDYYSRERVMSEEARQQWVEPDRRSL